MNSVLTGKCACGSVRYSCASAPVAMLNSHCADCQRSSGAPFASGVIVMSSDLQVHGTPKTDAVRPSSGKTTAQFESESLRVAAPLAAITPAVVSRFKQVLNTMGLALVERAIELECEAQRAFG